MQKTASLFNGGALSLCRAGKLGLLCAGVILA